LREKKWRIGETWLICAWGKKSRETKTGGEGGEYKKRKKQERGHSSGEEKERNIPLGEGTFWRKVGDQLTQRKRESGISQKRCEKKQVTSPPIRRGRKRNKYSQFSCQNVPEERGSIEIHKKAFTTRQEMKPQKKKKKKKNLKTPFRRTGGGLTSRRKSFQTGPNHRNRKGKPSRASLRKCHGNHD